MSSFIHSPQEYVELRNGLYDLFVNTETTADQVKQFLMQSDSLSDCIEELITKREIANLVIASLADLECACVVLQYEKHYEKNYAEAVRNEQHDIRKALEESKNKGTKHPVCVYKLLQSINYQSEVHRLFKKFPNDVETGILYRESYDLLRFLKALVADKIIFSTPQYAKCGW